MGDKRRDMWLYSFAAIILMLTEVFPTSFRPDAPYFALPVQIRVGLWAVCIASLVATATHPEKLFRRWWHQVPFVLAVLLPWLRGGSYGMVILDSLISPEDYPGADAMLRFQWLYALVLQCAPGVFAWKMWETDPRKGVD